ncbi:MAG: hypothetical protein B5766_07695 [Candidatus Lumbricidophila eiseniae]|uniref:Uncharacterized protein n=1 Tax=Candidatus Lumbricidiphila eiseniae TaxID=1969409 RepID=A0A2A6FRF7_9MICO|nr:MAG: hypothetical protein B5766_07695 [Candidatus Lumbricidophila eiseniae]
MKRNTLLEVDPGLVSGGAVRVLRMLRWWQVLDYVVFVVGVGVSVLGVWWASVMWGGVLMVGVSVVCGVSWMGGVFLVMVRAWDRSVRVDQVMRVVVGCDA